MTYSVFYSRGEFFAEVHASTPHALRQKIEEIDALLSGPVASIETISSIEYPAPGVLAEMHRDGPNPLPRDFEKPYRHPVWQTIRKGDEHVTVDISGQFHARSTIPLDTRNEE